MDARRLYIDMVKRCVLNIPYVDAELNPIQPHGRVRKLVLGVFKRARVQLAHTRRGDYQRRLAGHDVSDIAHSMVSLKRLDNVQMCLETVLREKIPGDLIETGVMRGGTVILMRTILKAYGITDRVIWAADSSRDFPRRILRITLPMPAQRGICVRSPRWGSSTSNETSNATDCSTTR